MFGTILGRVAAVAGEGAVRVAGSVAAIVDAIIALFAAIDAAVATLGAAASVAGALSAAIGGARVTLFYAFLDAIATGNEWYRGFAVARAGARGSIVLAVVALFAAREAELAITAPLDERAHLARLCAGVARGYFADDRAAIAGVGIAVVTIFTKIERTVAAPGNEHRRAHATEARGGGAGIAWLDRFAVSGTARARAVAVVTGFIPDHFGVAADDGGLAEPSGRGTVEERLPIAKACAAITGCGVAVVAGFGVAQVAVAAILIEDTLLAGLGTGVARLELAVRGATIVRYRATIVTGFTGIRDTIPAHDLCYWCARLSRRWTTKPVFYLAAAITTIGGEHVHVVASFAPLHHAVAARDGAHARHADRRTGEIGFLTTQA